MKIVILLNGEKPGSSFLQGSKYDRLFCADGAGNHLFAFGITPDLLMGDMDSIDPRVLSYYEENGVDIVRASPNKDETDGQLLVDRALSAQPEEIVIMGGLGERLDHSLGNLQLLLRCEQAGVCARCASEHEEVVVSTGKTVLLGERGDLVSVIPLLPGTCMSTKGMKYEVRSRAMPPDQPLGISNQMMREMAEITFEAGAGIIIHSKSGTGR